MTSGFQESYSTYRRRSRPLSYGVGWALLGLIVLGAIAVIDASGLPHETHPAGLILGLGALATWRYGWATLNAVRAVYYCSIAFPRRRRAAVVAKPASHVCVVVLSFQMDNLLNAAVYEALLRNLAAYGQPATVVACVSDQADVAQLRMLEVPSNVQLVPLQQSKRGKRDAMERGLDFLADTPIPPGAVVVLLDGDTLLPDATLTRSVPILLNDNRVGAITTDNDPLVAGSDVAREWYKLRMRSRHVLMSSLSLSGRVLVLTGRFSIFRAELALSRGFIAAVGRDACFSPRHGRIRMETGDDKSTWFWALRAGWNMLYVPDVTVYCLEKQPRPTFFDSSVTLMGRWYGNMARNSGRAIALGPGRLRVFVWIALIDQRISPWTTLVSPVAATLLVITGQYAAASAYVLWIIMTRTFQTMLLARLGREFHPFQPMLQYYNQMIGSGLKIYAFFNPQRQKWTRQQAGTTATVDRSNRAMWMSIGLFVLAVLAAAVA